MEKQEGGPLKVRQCSGSDCGGDGGYRIKASHQSRAIFVGHLCNADDLICCCPCLVQDEEGHQGRKRKGIGSADGSKKVRKP